MQFFAIIFYAKSVIFYTLNSIYYRIDMNALNEVNNHIKPHIGQNIARIRGMRRITQKEMAAKLNLAQPEYSKIEKRAEIDDGLLTLVAAALDVTPEAIKNFNEGAAINNISCTFNDNNFNTIYHFNPVEKIIELYETIIKQKDDMLKLKDEVIEMHKKLQRAS